MNIQSLLSNISQYISISNEDTEILLSKVCFKRLEKKEHLLNAGSVCRNENYIISGCFRKYYLDNDGVEHVILFACEGSWINEPQSFWAETPSLFSIEALEDAEIVQIQKSDLEALLNDLPKFERFFRIIGNQVFAAQQKRIKQNLSCSAAERYEDFKKDNPGLELRISQKNIASYLGITPEFFSVLRKKRP